MGGSEIYLTKMRKSHSVEVIFAVDNSNNIWFSLK
jgi:hypothetical protein